MSEISRRHAPSVAANHAARSASIFSPVGYPGGEPLTPVARDGWSPRRATTTERVVVLDAIDIPQLQAEALVTNDLLRKLGPNVQLATFEWGR